MRPILHAPIEAYRDIILACLQSRTMSQLVHTLEVQTDNWCLDTLNVLKQRSPLSLLVTLKQLHAAEGLSLAACLAMDTVLVKHFLQGEDFYEGVRAMLIDKDHIPHWQPPELSAVSDEAVNAYFKA
jgi:enoyl-CoA hydratase/carnithine racemase